MKEYDATPEGYLVDEKTLGYYTNRAEALLSSAVEERPVYTGILRDLLEESAAILDVGAGLGRDVCLLLEEGFDLRGIGPFWTPSIKLSSADTRFAKALLLLVGSTV